VPALPFLKTRDIQRLRGLAEKRIFSLNTQLEDSTGSYVLYWMQMTQRIKYNFALQYAMEQANKHRVPLVVYHALNEDYPYASDRIHTFILQGVKELYHSFQHLGINYGFYLVHGKKKPALNQLMKKAVCIVSDDYPTFVTKSFNERVAASCPVHYVVVDSCTVVPMRFFTKQEWSAASIRPQIKKVLAEALEEVVHPILLKKTSLEYPDYFLPPDFSVEREVADLSIDHAIKPVSTVGGETAAQEQLAHFIKHDLDTYDHTKNDPSVRRTSKLSAYLHFGMISPIDVALQVLRAKKLSPDSFLRSLITPDAVTAFLEELIVRRDLAYNYAHFNKNHTVFKGVPSWGKKTLREHLKDTRPFCYTYEQLAQGLTHDPLWNTAQLEMVYGGHMHGYMRMYWCKKLLEWTKKPEEAFAIAVRLNDTYQLDGRDPNGYTGIAWSLGGLHDRPWFTKPIYGNIRMFSATSLYKKFDVQKYISYVRDTVIGPKVASTKPDTNSKMPSTHQ